MIIKVFLIVSESRVKRYKSYRKQIDREYILLSKVNKDNKEVGGQAVLGRQNISPTPWLTERHGYDPTYGLFYQDKN